MGLFSKISEGLRKTRDSISGAIGSMLSSFTKIDDELFEELEEILIMSDIGAVTSAKICDTLKKRVKEEKIKDPEEIKKLLSQTVAEMVKGDRELKLSTKPSFVFVIGVNGVGKTTTIGKLASQLKANGKKVILGAADTFRAAAIEQLEVWAGRAGVDIVKSAEGADPASVVFDTIAAAKSRGSDVIICDTAGRLHNKKNLMNELAKMYRIIGRELPDADVETLLVLDATTGQNAVNQARDFKEVADITGIVLTKLDGTARGGVVLAIMDELKIPVKYIGVGEQIDDLQPFDPTEFAAALFEKSEKDEL
ncbi:MAG: signal recognition particle-docking protein FtsY [Acutalibacteraceae bacterium]